MSLWSFPTEMILGSPNPMQTHFHHATNHIPQCHTSVVLAKLQLVSLLSECGAQTAVLCFVCLLPGGGEAALVTVEGTLAALRLVTGQPHGLGLSALSGGSVNHQVCVSSLCSQLIAAIGTAPIKAWPVHKACHQHCLMPHPKLPCYGVTYQMCQHHLLGLLDNTAVRNSAFGWCLCVMWNSLPTSEIQLSPKPYAPVC